MTRYFAIFLDAHGMVTGCTDVGADNLQDARAEAAALVRPENVANYLGARDAAHVYVARVEAGGPVVRVAVGVDWGKE